jgi:hypothetical protein
MSFGKQGQRLFSRRMFFGQSNGMNSQHSYKRDRAKKA